MDAAPRHRKALLAALIVAITSTVFADSNLPPPNSPDNLLLPFSSSLALSSSTTEGPARLKRLVERLDAVREADVQVSGPSRDPQALVLVTWRPNAANTGAAVDLIASLALRTLPGLSLGNLVIADSSGAIQYDASRSANATVVLKPVVPWSLIAAAIVAAVLSLSLLVNLALYLAHRRSRPDASRALPLQLTGRSAHDLVALLEPASPPVRGAVLLALPEGLRRRISRKLEGGVDWPERLPDPPVLAAVLNALSTVQGGRQ